MQTENQISLEARTFWVGDVEGINDRHIPQLERFVTSGISQESFYHILSELSKDTPGMRRYIRDSLNSGEEPFRTKLREYCVETVRNFSQSYLNGNDDPFNYSDYPRTNKQRALSISLNIVSDLIREGKLMEVREDVKKLLDFTLTHPEKVEEEYKLVGAYFSIAEEPVEYFVKNIHEAMSKLQRRAFFQILIKKFPEEAVRLLDEERDFIIGNVLFHPNPELDLKITNVALEKRISGYVWRK